MALVQAIDIDVDVVKIKFGVTPRVSTITNDKLTLTLNGNPVASPFKDIIASEHYDSIGRILTLYFNLTLTPQEVYIFKLSGIKDAAGRSYPDFTYQFQVGEQATPNTDVQVIIDDTSPEFEPPVVAPVVVEDHSIKKHVFLDSSIIDGANSGFYVVKTEPANGDVFVEDSFERGRITIQFSQRPNPQFLNSQFIKVQRKKLGSVSRWEQVPIRISMDSYYPTIYVYIPSQDATPVYNTAGTTYFEDGYKYRVKVSKEVGV